LPRGSRPDQPARSARPGPRTRSRGSKRRPGDPRRGESALGVIGLVGLAIVVVWPIGFPGDDDEKELAGDVTANWDRIKDSIDHH